MKPKHQISRRSFIQTTALGTFSLLFTPFHKLKATELTVNWPAYAAQFKFHMIGHGHIDPIWLWRWTEGLAVVLSTFRSALDRLNEQKDMVFTSSSALFYVWVKENDPQMFEEILKRVKEGRWNIVGGWWVEPDMNMLHGESMVRQGLYGQLTFQKLLGIRAKIAFNPDAFGHANTIPQIVKLQGMNSYVFMRPMAGEKAFPSNLFWWEGADGTKVMTYRIQDDYSDNGDVRGRINSMLYTNQNNSIQEHMAFYGVGDHGGGPTKANLKSIAGIQQEAGAPKLQYNSVDAYFDLLHQKTNLNLPTVKDEFQHHAVGCYTAESAIKKNNRLTEASLLTAEKIASIGFLFWKVNYPSEKLRNAWEKTMLLQFHDSLPGTSLVSHSVDAANGYGRALDIADETIYQSLQKLEWQVASEVPEHKYLLAFNPHAWEVDAILTYQVGFREIADEVYVCDHEDTHLPHQYELGEAQTLDTRGISFEVKLPPLGYKQIRIIDGVSKANYPALTTTANSIANEFIKLIVHPNGEISIEDLKLEIAVFEPGKTGCKALVLQDKSDTWGHGVSHYDHVIGQFDHAHINLLENGPFKATLRVTSYYGKSKLIIDWVLFAGRKEVLAKVQLDWQEQLKMLKFSFPLALKDSEITYETPYGHIVRPANGREEPALRWISGTGKVNDKAYGLSIINDAKYGYSAKDSDLRLSITRSAVYAHHVPLEIDPNKGYTFMDQGIQTMKMLLIPHEGNWKENNIPRQAEEFIAPALCMYQGIHPGHLPKSASFLSINSKNINISSIKESEDKKDLIIRCVETLGESTEAVLSIPTTNHHWKGSFRPLEIKSLRYNLKKGKFTEINLLEE